MDDVHVGTGRELSVKMYNSLQRQIPPRQQNTKFKMICIYLFMQKNRKANRLPGYDYSSDALYFVTPVVKNRICSLGKIINDEMHLNEAGAIVERQWNWLTEQYPYIILHSFQVMPNHAHGIIEIRRELVEKIRDLSAKQHHENERAANKLSQLSKTIKIKSISELMGAFKMTSSKHIHTLPNTGSVSNSCLSDPLLFTWQRSFYDHIIRDQNSFENISHYIETNPQNWKDDRFFT